jgi:hypothetical protein
MDFLNHGREIFRQALGEAIRNHIPEGARIPIVLGLLLMGSSYAIAPGFFRHMLSRRNETEGESDNYNFSARCMGVLMLIAARYSVGIQLTSA